MFFINRQIHGNGGSLSAAAVIVYAMIQSVQIVTLAFTKWYQILKQISEFGIYVNIHNTMK